MPHDPAYEARVTQLLTALKGAPLSCLFAMLLLDRRVGAKELQTITGYSKVTILGGLEKLEKMGFAARYARYESWQLTDKGVQLPLWPKLYLADGQGEVQNLNLEVQKIFSGSSSSSLTLNSAELEQQPQLPAPGEVQNLNLEGQELNLEVQNLNLPPDDPAMDALFEMLVRECAAPREYAAEAAQAVAERVAKGEGDFQEAEKIARDWLAYCKTPQAKGIDTKGIFIARKVQKDEPCVDFEGGEEDAPVNGDVSASWRKFLAGESKPSRNKSSRRKR